LAVELYNKNNKRATKINVLLDEGSDRSYINETIAQQLGLRGVQYSLKMTGAGGKITNHDALNTCAQLRALDDKVDQKVMFTVIPNTVGNLPLTDWEPCKRFWPHLDEVPFVKLVEGTVQGLLGGDVADLLAATKPDVVGKPGEPVARHCKLGWTILGRTRPQGADASESKLRAELREIQSQVHKCITEQIIEQESYLDQTPARCFAAFDFSRRKEVLDSDLNEMIRKQMELESLPDDEEKQLSREDRWAIQTMEKTMRQLPDGRYECGALWKKNEPQMPNNIGYALKRHKNFIESRQMQKPEVLKGVQDSIEEWLQNDFIRKVPKEERLPKEAFYLPIFVVSRADAETTKHRVVTDGKAEYRNFSLNKAMLAGPSWIKDVTLTLARFRRYSYAMMGDVSKMFLQISLAEKDRKYHRFLWTPDKNKEPEEYEFKVHCFGNAGSPSVAISVVRDYAKKNQKRFPRAADAILNATHVDDTLDSFETIEEAIKTAKEIQLLYSEIKMQLRKFASNSEDFMKAFEKSNWAADFELIGDNQKMTFPTKKALGVVWNTGTDEFSFPTSEKLGLPKSLSQPITKRIILQELARVFDPIGIISPVLVNGRTILQDCWKAECGWDDIVPEKLQKAWRGWIEDSQLLPEVKIPRVLVPTREGDKVKETQLHTFCDASGYAYGFIMYVRVLYESGFIYVNIACSKAKVAPIKQVSIPRLELEAAVTGARMTKPMAQTLETPKLYCWTDSMNVLWWINTAHKELKMYVANRVDVIINHTESERWRHVGTHENPADIASRGSLLKDLLVNDLWWQGPKFLKTEEKDWPAQPSFEISEEAKKELKTKDEVFCGFIGTFTSSSDPADSKRYALPSELMFIDVSRHSTWISALRAVATIFLQVGRILRRSHKPDKDFQPSQKVLDTWTISRNLATQKAEKLVIRQAQMEAYPEMMDELRKGLKITNKKLITLRPFLDEEGILRVGSRVAHVKNLHLDQRQPMIIPKDSHIGQLLIRHIHADILKHVGGHAHALAELQTRFWIVGGREFCKKIISKCVECKVRRTQPLGQEQGHLPDYRVPSEKVAPFAHTIIDAAGPFMVKKGRGRQKKYVILFSCMVTRAVHFETVADLSQDAFLMSFQNFVSRRGMPKICRSDNGTNFRGAVNDLMQLGRVWDPKKAEKKGFGQIQWIFATPLAPHTQGAIERVVGLMKQGLNVIIGSEPVEDSVLESAVIQVEGILNSRPLTYASDDPADPRPITPNDFLMPWAQREPEALPTEDPRRLLKALECHQQVAGRLVEVLCQTDASNSA
jgi:hypothetical protein